MSEFTYKPKQKDEIFGFKSHKNRDAKDFLKYLLVKGVISVNLIKEALSETNEEITTAIADSIEEQTTAIADSIEEQSTVAAIKIDRTTSRLMK